MSRYDDGSLNDHTRRLRDWRSENENGARVAHALAGRPRNATPLAPTLERHYRTVIHHRRRLATRGAVTAVGEGNGETCFLAVRLATSVEGERADAANRAGRTNGGGDDD